MDEFIKKNQLEYSETSNKESTLINTGHAIAIVRLQEEMKLVNNRLDNIEKRFEKFENDINERFDKLEVANNLRRKEAQEMQEKLFNMVSDILEETKKTNNRVTRLEDHKNIICAHCQEDVKELKNFKWQTYGVIIFVVFILTVWGQQIFQMLFGSSGDGK